MIYLEFCKIKSVKVSYRLTFTSNKQLIRYISVFVSNISNKVTNIYTFVLHDSVFVMHEQHSVRLTSYVIEVIVFRLLYMNFLFVCNALPCAMIFHFFLTWFYWLIWRSNSINVRDLGRNKKNKVNKPINKFV